MKWIFNDWFNYEGEMYFFHALNGAFGRYNFDDNKIYFCPMFDDFQKDEHIEKYFMAGDYVYCIITSGRFLFRLNMKDKTTSKIEIDANQKNWGNYSFATLWDDSLFLFLRNKPEVIEIKNISSDSVTLEKHTLDNNYFLGTLQGEKVWLVTESGDNLCQFNMNDYTFSSTSFREECINPICFCSDEKKIYAVSCEADIYSIDTMNLSAQKIATLPAKDNYTLVNSRNTLIFLPFHNDDIYTFNKEQQLASKYSNYPCEIKYGGVPEWSRYLGSQIIGNKIYFAQRSANMILIIDSSDGSIDWIKPMETTNVEDMGFLLKHNELIRESSDLNLKAMVECMK